MHPGIAWLVPAVALVSYCTLLFIVGREKTHTRACRSFELYLLCLIIWSLGSLMTHVGLGDTLFWFKVMMAGGLGWALALFRFIQVFLDRRRRWSILLYSVGAVDVVIIFVTNQVIRSASVEMGVLSYEFGVLLPIVGAMGYFPILFGLVELIRGYREVRSGVERNRIRYLLAGTGMIVASSLVKFTALGSYPIDVAANAVNAFLITYAILRYRLPDITLVIRKGLLYSLPTTVIAIGYFLLIFAVEKLFRAFMGYQVLLLSLFVAAITAIAVQPFRDKAQLLIDRLFFREKYDTQLMLQELSKLAASILDIKKLTSLLLDRLTATMHVKRACIMLKEKEDARFHLVAQKGQTRLQEEAIFREDDPVVRWLASHKQPLTRHDLDVLPQFKALWAEECQDLDRIEAELFIPLTVREELIGILILGPKLSEAPYSPDEQLALTTLASQTAVAIQNAWLYSDLEATVEELKQMQAQLVPTEKLSALGEMIAGVAHEINNPLTAVIGYSQLLQAMDLGSQVREDLGQILEAGLRVKRIVANLLEFSRQYAPHKEYLDVNEVLSSSLELRAHDLITSGVRIETDMASGLPRTMADRHQLQQVFVNIINNAQQAMAEKGGPGVLTVSTRPGENNTILISFQDTGPGIPPEIMGRIFDPFFTTKEMGKGTGLGLSVSYGIVQEHQGRIWAQSPAPGGTDGGEQGTTFFIQLPVRDSAPADTQ